MNGPGNADPGQIPPAYRRIGIPAGSDVRIKTKPGGTPPRLIVESVDGELLTVTITPDGKLDMKYDPARITEAAEQFIVEVRALLRPDASNRRIRVHTDDTGRPPATGVR
jgi:hypothetical protein